MWRDYSASIVGPLCPPPNLPFTHRSEIKAGGAVAIQRDDELIVLTRFSRAEAEALLGRQVRTKLAIDGVPAGALGQVMQLDDMERGAFDLIVEWSVLVHGKRQHNWFSKDDYHQQLAEVEELSTNA